MKTASVLSSLSPSTQLFRAASTMRASAYHSCTPDNRRPVSGAVPWTTSIVKECPVTKRPRPNKLDNTDQQAQQQPSNPNSAMDETDESDDESEIADEPPLDPLTITTSLPTKRNLTDELQATVGSKRNLITKSPTKTTKKTKSTDEPTSEDFNAFYDLLGSTDETLKFLQVSFKMTNKARSLYLQAEHGDYDSTKSGNLRLNDSPQLTQLWQKHSRKQKTADKAMDELKQLYITHFHGNSCNLNT